MERFWRLMEIVILASGLRIRGTVKALRCTLMAPVMRVGGRAAANTAVDSSQQVSVKKL
jgi:hypothetical protein